MNVGDNATVVLDNTEANEAINELFKKAQEDGNVTSELYNDWINVQLIEPGNGRAKKKNSKF